MGSSGRRERDEAEGQEARLAPLSKPELYRTARKEAQLPRLLFPRREWGGAARHRPIEAWRWKVEAGPGRSTGRGARHLHAAVSRWAHAAAPSSGRTRPRGGRSSREVTRDEVRPLSLVGKNPSASSKSRKPSQR